MPYRNRTLGTTGGIMSMRYLAYLATLVFASLTVATAQEAKTHVKHEAAPMTSPASGKEMFVSYCASCHGKDAKGDGPAATSPQSRCPPI